MKTLALVWTASLMFLSMSVSQAQNQVPPGYLDTVPGSFSETLQSQAIHSFKNFEQGPFSASIHGIFHEINQHLVISVPNSEISLRTSYLKGGELSAQLHVSMENGQVRRAPLAIVLNPLFSEKNYRQMTRFLEFFGSRGFHVVVFENTWSDAVTKLAPTFFPGDVRAESAMHRELIEAVVKRIGEQNVSGATLAGLSYGAFLGAVIKAEDAESARPRINGPVFLLNPPYDIVHSMHELDGVIRESSARNKLSLLACNFPALLANGFIIGDSQYVKMNEQCAQDFLGLFGFQAPLLHMVEVLNDSKNLGLSQTEIAAVTFDNYVGSLARVHFDPTITELNHWMERARGKGFDSFLVLGSTDDPINAGFDFSRTLAGPIAEGHFFEVPTGGHTGLRSAKSLDQACGSTNWFDCLLAKVYP